MFLLQDCISNRFLSPTVTGLIQPTCLSFWEDKRLPAATPEDRRTAELDAGQWAQQGKDKNTYSALALQGHPGVTSRFPQRTKHPRALRKPEGCWQQDSERVAAATEPAAIRHQRDKGFCHPDPRDPKPSYWDYLRQTHGKRRILQNGRFNYPGRYDQHKYLCT